MPKSVTRPFRSSFARSQLTRGLARSGPSHRRQRLLDAADARRPRMATGARPNAGPRSGTPKYGSAPGGTPRPYAPAWTTAGKRTRCRCSARVASRWASASDGQGSRTSSANSACPLSHEASGSPRSGHRRGATTARRPRPAYTRGDGCVDRRVEHLPPRGDTVTFIAMPDDPGVEIAQLARNLRARDVELALHVPVVGDTVAPFMAPPDTDPVALRAIHSLAILPADPAAATEEIQRRREEIGFSYFVFGAGSADIARPGRCCVGRTLSPTSVWRPPRRSLAACGCRRSVVPHQR